MKGRDIDYLAFRGKKKREINKFAINSREVS